MNASLNSQIKGAFTEYMLTTFRIPKGAVDAYWEIFYKSLKWRIYPEKYIGGEYPYCLFVHIPRTGGTSINSILGQYGGHKVIEKYQRVINPEMWNRLFKFSIVRNPYTRFISGYHLVNRRHKFGDANEHIKRYGMTKVMDANITVFIPQYDYLYIDGQLAVDHVGRFEQLEEEWKHLSSVIGCDKELPRKNVSQEKPFELTKETRDTIYSTYKKDFKSFGYKR